MKQPAFNALLKQAAARLDAFDFGEALKLYNQANKLKPGNAAAQMGMAVVFNRTGESATALVILQKLWQAVQAKDAKVKKVTQSEIMAQVGMAFEQLGQTEQALGCYRLSSKIFSNESILRKIESLTKASAVSAPFEQLLKHAQALVNQGNMDDAARTYRAALILNADSDKGLHGLADCLRQMNDLTGALQCAQQAILLKPDDAVYQNTLGLIYLQKNETSKSIKVLQRALKLSPKYAAAYINLGVAYKRIDKLSDAVKAYETAIKLRPDMPQAHNNLGNVFNLLGDKVSAKQQYEIAIKLQPDYQDAIKNLKELTEGADKVEVKKKSPIPKPKKTAAKQVPKKTAAKKVVTKAAKKAVKKSATQSAKKPSVKVKSK
jgi:tetratricopeptide (TPR) repeat protein